ncbi:MAG: DNA polymerase IV, partial [Clostridiales bacterium]|nr:DNA polymerase IV [Clostridiales bacterium]
RYTSQVEPFGPDECWLDVTDSLSLFGSGQKIADELRETVKRETGLTLSVGVSFNKTFAKMGSDLKKPDATSVVSRENFRRVLWPLPVSDMLMVGKKSVQKLHALNIFTVGDLARADESLLSAHFGITGVRLKRNANGEDDETVHEVGEKEDEKSMGQGMTAARDITSYEDAETLILYLADKVATRLRKASLRGYGVSLSMRAADLTSFVRQKMLTNPTCTARHIADAAKELLHANWKCDYPLRTLTVSVYDLTKIGAVQMDMFAAPPDKTEKLESAIDAIRDKYGETAIMRAGIFGLDFIVDKK